MEEAGAQEAPLGGGSSCSSLSCRIVDVGHSRWLDLGSEVPPSELVAVCMHEQWVEVYQRLVELINEHRSTLIFVNTRKLAERLTYQLTELLGEDVVGSHHGSLSADIRLKTEQRLKSGELKAVVATASLELGLDVGYIDLVVQVASPRSIATFLQRIGRSGHSLGLVPKGRLFALSRDELLEGMALIHAVCAGRLDAIAIPEAPLDVLAQQIVAEVAGREWNTDELFALFRGAYPYRKLKREDFDRTIGYLSEGISNSAGRGRVYLHHDLVQKRVRARRGARIAAVSNAGAIPEIASYRVVAEPDGTVVGTLDEDFAVESNRGDIFLLGNTSWRIQSVRGGDVQVADAQGAPPTIPFWRGEAPGRTFELSEEVSRLREELERRLEDPAVAAGWLREETRSSTYAAEQTVAYVQAQKAAIGLVPTQERVVFERFFDETGGMQLLVHAPFGSAVNRAWGFAMRKRFCRSYDFELQATADDNGFILSLGPQHSFPIESLFAMLNPRNARELLEQAVLAVPMFQVRWRWNVTRALLVLRMRNGKKVPPAFQRFRADDLLTAVFPRLTGCQEEHTGDIELPDHPLVNQTMEDCLHEALDADGLIRVLSRIERGETTLIARDTREPSPFCYELLNGNVYTFLDGGEIQERRTRAVSTRRAFTVESVSDLGQLDREAIEQVREEAQPLVRSADELHDALLSRILLPVSELSDCGPWYAELAAQRRATTVCVAGGSRFWAPAERLPAVLAVFPAASLDPPIAAPDGVRLDWPAGDARVAITRGLLEVCGPITATDVAERLAFTTPQAEAALEALEGEGVVLRGRFTPSDAADANGPPGEEPPREVEWCHRRLLARIHRLTLEGLRKQIEPVGVDVFIRHLARHHGMLPGSKRTGPNGLYEVVAMLQGLDVPAIAWERDLLPARLDKYGSEWLDELCLTGETGWGRLFPSKQNPDRSKPMASLTRVALISLFLRGDVEWLTAMRPKDENGEQLSSPAEEVCEILQSRGAMFAADLMHETRMLPTQLENALGELISRGWVTADGFAGLRRLIAEKPLSPRRSRRSRGSAVRKRGASSSSGRWSLWRRENGQDAEAAGSNGAGADAVEQWAWQLLRRWGVVFRDLLEREAGAPSWFELLQVYRRLEARGEIRGGRFVRGVGGEQFALGDTIKQLRALRDQESRGELVVVSAVDPLNLVGILTDHSRVPSTAGNRVAYMDGVPVAALVAGEVGFFSELSNEARAAIAERLGAPVGSGRRDIVEGPESKGEASGLDAVISERARDRTYPSKIPRPMIS